MTGHGTLNTTGNLHTPSRVHDEPASFRNISDADYRARLTLIAVSTRQTPQSALTLVGKVHRAPRGSATPSKANKTGANTTSLNANACARRGFSSTSTGAEQSNKVTKSESSPLWKSAEERTAALSAMVTSAPALLTRPSSAESGTSSIYNLPRLSTEFHTVHPLPKRPSVTIDAAAIAAADHFLATFEFSAHHRLSVEDVNRNVSEGRRLYIGNLDYAATPEDLTEFFKGYNVECTSVPFNPATDKQASYAFVDVSTSSDAHRAVTDLHGKSIRGRMVSVQLARTLDEPQQSTREGGRLGRKRKRKPDESL